MRRKTPSKRVKENRRESVKRKRVVEYLEQRLRFLEAFFGEKRTEVRGEGERKWRNGKDGLIVIMEFFNVVLGLAMKAMKG